MCDEQKALLANPVVFCRNVQTGSAGLTGYFYLPCVQVLDNPSSLRPGVAKKEFPVPSARGRLHFHSFVPARLA